ncbi:Type III flagellar switch regulator (C-ring) FliN C-term [Rhodovulum sp. ES.010]|uniref:FliM/FliN family flagellar motor switch protein n=1 Tax=Rhodovulum sp. ES.010 TaxID=1882821 RepID=UPI000929459C|nr:FliM/FliN family flagellar motor switch protein [Rhodovulum sp. ES.010]SIO12127.1 Type III flagellar switch regulator (C-ring) FliN C-term [Rhodovulum sp. ES.010]
MTDDAHRAILRQIVGDSRVEVPRALSGEGGADGRIALRLETARAVREDFGLTAVVEACTPFRPRLEELQGEVLPERLAITLAGGEERTGLLVLSPELALALLEWRLLGMLAEEAPAARPFTGTDAAILADLVDPWLTRFAAAMAERAGSDWAQGYRQGARVEDARHVPLILAEGGYHGFRMTLSLGAGTRGGEMLLALPESHAPAPAKPAEGAGMPWPQAMRAGVLGAELALTAVLWRTRLPAAALGQLRPGDMVPIPAAALTAVRLEAPGRVAVAEGRLGQANGERAVRIETIEGDPPGLAAPSAAPGLTAPEPDLPMAAAPADPGADMPFPASAAPGAPEEEDGGFPVAEAGGFPAMADLPEDLAADFPAMAPPND